jgi:hypothetical protein
MQKFTGQKITFSCSFLRNSIRAQLDNMLANTKEQQAEDTGG